MSKLRYSTKITIYKKTNEDWYPSIIMDGGQYIEVSFIPLSNKKFRVCAWGDDDFGMEKDFESKDRFAAYSLFKEIEKIEQPLTKSYFKNKGFINA